MASKNGVVTKRMKRNTLLLFLALMILGAILIENYHRRELAGTGLAVITRPGYQYPKAERVPVSPVRAMTNEQKAEVWVNAAVGKYSGNLDARDAFNTAAQRTNAITR